MKVPSVLLIYILFIFCVILSCKHQTQSQAFKGNEETKPMANPPAHQGDSLLPDSTKKYTAEEEAVLKKVMDLQEVKLASAYADSISNHKHGITLIISAEPGKEQDYYTVQAGYTSDIRFEVYFNFYIYPKGMTIKYYDVMTDTALPLEEWRKQIKKGTISTPY